MSKEDNSAMGRGRLIWIIALCSLLSGCFLFPTAVKRETLLLPVIESAATEGTYSLQENGATSWELAGLRLEVEHMTDAKLNALFPDESGRGKYSTNPYTYGNWTDTRLGYTPNRFTVFKVTIFNRTQPKVMLDPLAAVLETDQGQFLRRLRHHFVVALWQFRKLLPLAAGSERQRVLSLRTAHGHGAQL